MLLQPFEFVFEDVHINRYRFIKDMPGTMFVTCSTDKDLVCFQVTSQFSGTPINERPDDRIVRRMTIDVDFDVGASTWEIPRFPRTPFVDMLPVFWFAVVATLFRGWHVAGTEGFPEHLQEFLWSELGQNYLGNFERVLGHGVDSCTGLAL